MSTKSRITEKGDMWEWENTPETEEALKKLHNRTDRASIKREDDTKGYDTYSKYSSFHSFFIMKYQLDEYDLKMIRTALCYFDMYEDGSYDKWFGKDQDKMNESFDYLYEITS